VPRDEDIPSESQIFGRIEDIFARGVRRPGYPADRWAEDWIAGRFRELLEHTANEVVERDGTLVATGEPEARWWFTSRIPRLEAAVRSAIEMEGLTRSLVLRPDTFGPHPTTDGGFFHLEGVPLVNYLTAPFYLFDAMDTLDKIHRPSLVPVTRAAARIIESTAAVSAAAMRQETA
jgi:hypothetical protein